MRHSFSLLLLANVVAGSQAIFSVHDDILAFPQYEIVFPDSFVTKAEADSLLAFASSSASTSPQPTTQDQQPAESSTDVAKGGGSVGNDGGRNAHGAAQDEPRKTYESMRLDGSEYLCTIPMVEVTPRNEVAEAQARAEEAKELARAAGRGWELLADMQGHCLYFLSGWWSYEFCYNGQVKQFHQQPPQRGMPTYPPIEDPSTPSYVLGQMKKQHDDDGERQTEPDRGKDLSDHGQGGVDGAELQVKGDTRFLVQKLGAGTTCDLTGKERRVEIQFRCNPHSSDRIGWIKEVTTCAYLMVVDTPRLCDDVAFLPPRQNQAHPVTCQEILLPEAVSDWEARQAADAQRQLLHNVEKVEGDNDESGKQPEVVIGGIRVGAHLHVGAEGRRIDGGASVAGVAGTPDVIATGESKGGPVSAVTDENLKRLELNPEAVKKLREELQEIAGEKGWKLELVEQEGGTKHIQGVVEADDEDGEEAEAPANQPGEGGERRAEGGDKDKDDDEVQGGSEEGYYEEL